MVRRAFAAAAVTDADFSLDQRLCLALYTASRAMTARYRLALSTVGLTYPQYLVMLLLWEDGPCSVGEIGQRLSLDSSTLSPLLKRLQAMELVTRTRTKRDERLMIVGLTEHGVQLEQEAADVTVALSEATGLSRDEQRAMVTQLRELNDRLDASTASSGNGGPLRRQPEPAPPADLRHARRPGS